MARQPRVQALSRSFTAAFDGAVEEQTAQLAAFARSEHGKIMAEEPQPTGFRRWVDGHAGAPEETVKPDGVIRYAYDRLDEVVQFALATLRDLSPVLFGLYRDSHQVFVNETAIDSLADSLGDTLASRRADSEVVIANGVPYARKIEYGTMKMKLPGTSHVYQQAETIVKRRMGNIAKVKFTWRTVLPAGVQAGGRTSGGLAGARTRTVEDAYRFPALVITER